MSRQFASWILIVFLIGLPSATYAQSDYPSRDVRLIVGYAAGSGPDNLTRQVAEAIRKGSGQTAIVENRPGALTNIAAQMVARAKPDGYTVFVTAGNSTMAANPWLFKDLPYDPIKDFTPVTSLVRGSFVFAVPLGSPINSVAELTAMLKAKGNKAKYAYANSISLAASELYKQRAGLDAVGVAYKSIPDSHTALAAGEVDFFIADMNFMSRSKILALTTAERTPLAPDIPSAKEAGLDNFDLGLWWAVWLPAGAPPDVVAKLAKLIDDNILAELKRDQGAGGSAPWLGVHGDDLKNFTVSEIAKWREVIKLAKIEPQ